jgi:hypothetical protein
MTQYGLLESNTNDVLQVKPNKSVDLRVARCLPVSCFDPQDEHYVPSKCRWASTGLHGVTPPKTVLFKSVQYYHGLIFLSSRGMNISNPIYNCGQTLWIN